ncbi:Gfo/Idh/MocA family oxidoreductase [Rhizobiaceae bacterium]|nr:Gfo/Idh/MocA family oxidoreductase [Rhizobiaceae bacterium]
MPEEAPRLAVTGLAADLARRAEQGHEVRVSIIGAGQMGTDLILAIDRMPGMRIANIVDRSLKRAPDALVMAGRDASDGTVCDTAAQATAAFEAGCIPIFADAHAAISHDLVDVVIDATGSPEAGAEYGEAALEAGKHLVMMNVEADVTVGAILSDIATRKDLVYTVGAGDEPSSVMELYDFVTALGYPVVCAGKGKNNAFRIDAVPDDYREEAERRNMNPRMLVEFVDGSKTMVEMVAIANATGLMPDRPGMHGPDCALDDLCTTLVPQSEGGILESYGCVDFTVGKGVAPGVFVVADMRHPRVRERLNDLHLGPGPFYTFYRPYHLTSLEVPLSAARGVLYGTSDMKPLPRPVAEVCALAKRDLKAGDTLDFIGETSYRSWAMRAAEARAARAIPVGLLNGATVTADIAKGALITADTVAPRTDTPLYKLRARQDAWLGYA